ncbi:hypothetical protein [Frigoriglobus tundricola]|uniref:Thioester domain-containing protein n=1 Tax=Frigoriglobus tundricola TaxID=2774151 RepID=A0A6M5Z2N5_9BACT|nr:hypothetical protein [Frigoriglobus tundricola]QJX00336.1 hypothetical protein FTUN_7962 [Frigoriglobus tundricola]
MGNALVRALLAITPIALNFSSRALAQEPALEVFYTKLDPKEPFKYTWKGKEGACSAGVFRWEVPKTEFGTNGLDRNFTGYCSEVLVPITADQLYRFKVNSIYAPGNFGLAAAPNADRAAERRAKYVQELFGRFYRDPTNKDVPAPDAVAFQVALWEIIQETEPADGAPKLDLFAGDFRANYPPEQAPASVTQAQQYLNALTGNDALYYENPDLKGRELIRLQGLPNAQNVVAQSQFALRYVGGGAVGAGGLSRALTAGGGIGAGGFGAPGLGSGLGSGGGGGGGVYAGGNNGSGSPQTTPSSPSGTTSSSGSSSGNTGSVSSPPGGGPVTGGGGDPGGPTSPVPGPAGVWLGLIALGTIGSWRIGAKLLGSK